MLYLALLSCSLCYVKLHVVHVLLFEQIKKEGRKVNILITDRLQENQTWISACSWSIQLVNEGFVSKAAAPQKHNVGIKNSARNDHRPPWQKWWGVIKLGSDMRCLRLSRLLMLVCTPSLEVRFTRSSLLHRIQVRWTWRPPRFWMCLCENKKHVCFAIVIIARFIDMLILLHARDGVLIRALAYQTVHRHGLFKAQTPERITHFLLAATNNRR